MDIESRTTAKAIRKLYIKIKTVQQTLLNGRPLVWYA